MSINFLKRDKHGEFYFLEWKNGYIQIWEDWSQYFQPKKYNWLNFRPIWFEIDYDRLAGEHLSIEFGLLGFNLRFHQFIKDNKRGREIRRQTREIKSLQEIHEDEVGKLKLKLKKLKKQLSSLRKN